MKIPKNYIQVTEWVHKDFWKWLEDVNNDINSTPGRKSIIVANDSWRRTRRAVFANKPSGYINTRGKHYGFKQSGKNTIITG